MLTGDQSSNESSRLANLFKYLAATAAASGHIASDIDNVSTYDPSTARLSTDPVFNALAQLACLKVDTNRAFISLIDEEHQNVVAEATSSISLFDVSHHGPNGGLSVGSRILDLHAGVCAGTMPAFLHDSPRPYADTDNIFADRSRYVIRDFRKEEKYKDRPYVIDFPFMRFYAEVPIISSQGYVIGTLAAVDNRPRDNLSEDHYHALAEIARTIMRHIELTMVDQHHRRAAKLLTGLNHYVQADGLERANHTELSSNDKHTLGVRKGPLTDQREYSLPSPGSPSPEVTHAGMPTESVHSPEHSGHERLSQNSTLQQPENTLNSNLDGTTSMSPMAQNDVKQDLEKDTKEAPISKDLRASFGSASKILLEATGLDDVVFYDACTSRFAPQAMVMASTTARDQRNDTATHGRHTKSESYDNNDDTFDDIENSVPASADETPLPTHSNHTVDPLVTLKQLEKATLLARSAKTPSQSTTTTTTTTTSSVLPEIVHQSLLDRFPKGHLFDFSQSDAKLPSLEALSEILLEHNLGDSKQASRPLSYRYLVAAIRWALPQARSVVFMPVWSPSKHNWLAGCLGWTSQPKRVLQQEELSYFSVFSNCLAADVARIELTVSDRAKSDFISSISHEIRSPLHGILGSAELARRNSESVEQIRLIEMIEKCGETLLDTMEHILDYAKISTAVVSGRNVGSGDNGKVVKNSSIFEIGEVIEDTVGAVLAGYLHNTRVPDSSGPHKAGYSSLLNHDYRKISDTGLTTPISVVLNVQSPSSWQVESSIAAWRRIVLNTFGNALKYTEKGLIEITFEVQDVAANLYGPEYNSEVSLTVRDTGRGIGRHFLQNHLFTPFIQEDSLAVGTGLGLSIIKRIVQDLNGDIDVQSEVGIGTQVKITIPMKVISAPQLVPELQVRGTIKLVGLHSSANLESPDTGPISNEHKTIAAIRHAVLHAANQSQLELVVDSENDQTATDIIVISESHLQTMYTILPDGSSVLEIPDGSGLLVLPPITSLSNSLRTPKRQPRIEYVARPLGPRQLIAALVSLLAVDRGGILRIPDRSDPATVNQSRGLQAPTIRVGAKDNTTKPRARLLLVDDNDINIKLLSAQARKLSCDYQTASNGQEALDIFKSTTTPFDFVLMDLSMPVMDGFASARAMRAWEREEKRSATPIIALTGLSSADAQQYALTSGIDIFMTKPVPMTKIEALIEGGLGAVGSS